MAGTCVKVYHGNFTMLPDAARVLACLHEKDVKFELQEMNKGSNLPPEFFKLQASPRAPGPAFDDGTRVLFESRAICRYISEKYSNQGNRYLLGRDLLERSSIEQWVKSEEHSFDPPSWTLVFHLAFAPCLHLEPDMVQIQESENRLSEVLDVYEQRLAESKYLAGNEFSLADLTHLPNSYYLANSKDWSYLFTSRKHVNRWWKRISGRASWKEAARILDKVPIPSKQRDDSNDNTAVTISFYKEHSPKATTLTTIQQTVNDATVTLESSSHQEVQRDTEATTTTTEVAHEPSSETMKSPSLLQKSDFHSATTFNTQVQSMQPTLSPQEDTTEPSKHLPSSPTLSEKTERAKPSSYDMPSPIPLIPMTPTSSSGVPSMSPELVETKPSKPFGSPTTEQKSSSSSLLMSQVDMPKATTPSSSAPTVKASAPPAPTTPQIPTPQKPQPSENFDVQRDSVQVDLAKLEPTLPSIAPKAPVAIPTLDGHQVSRPTSTPPSNKKIDLPSTTPPSDVIPRPSKPSLPPIMEKTPPTESPPETKKPDSPLPNKQEILQPSKSPAPSTPAYEMDAPEPPKLSLPSTAKPDALHEPPQKEFKSPVPSTTNLDAFLPSAQTNAPQPSDESLPFPTEIETSLPSIESKEAQPSKSSPSSTTQAGPTRVVSFKAPNEHDELSFPPTSQVNLPRTYPTGKPQQPETAPKPQASDFPSTTSKVDTLLPSHQQVPLLSGSLFSSMKETNILSAPSQPEASQSQDPSLPSSTKPETILPFNGSKGPQQSEPSSSSTTQPDPTTIASSKDPIPQETSSPPTSKVDLPPTDPNGEPQPPETAPKPQALDSSPSTPSEVPSLFGSLSSSTRETSIPSAHPQPQVPQSQESSPPSSSKPKTSLPSTESKGPQPTEPSSNSTVQPVLSTSTSFKSLVPQESPFSPPSKDSLSPMDMKDEPQTIETAPKPQALDSPSTTLKVDISLPSHQEDPPSSGSLSFSTKETNISLAIPQPEAPKSHQSSSPSSTRPETSLPSTKSRGPQPSEPSSVSATRGDPTIVVSSKALLPQESSFPLTPKDGVLPSTDCKGEPQSPEMALKPQALDSPTTNRKVDTSLPSHQEVPPSFGSLSSSTKETNISSVPSQPPEAPQSQESSVLPSTKPETPLPSTESKGHPQLSKPSPSSATMPPEPSLATSISAPISSNTQTEKDDEPSSPSFPPSVSKSSSHPSKPSHSDDDAMNSTSQIALARNGQSTDSTISKSTSPLSSPSPTNIPNDAATPAPESNASPPGSKPIVPPDLHSPSN